MWGTAVALKEDSGIPGPGLRKSETRRQGCSHAPDSPSSWVGPRQADHLSQDPSTPTKEGQTCVFYNQSELEVLLRWEFSSSNFANSLEIIGGPLVCQNPGLGILGRGQRIAEGRAICSCFRLSRTTDFKCAG